MGQRASRSAADQAGRSRGWQRSMLEHSDEKVKEGEEEEKEAQ